MFKLIHSTFFWQILTDQIERDQKVDNLANVMQDLYQYVLELSSIQKISSYKKTLERLLTQTSECAYFIADYQRVALFGVFFCGCMYEYPLRKYCIWTAQRLMNNMMVSNADAIISQFESAFGDLKIELILGSTLQTTIVSFRILQKVENIGKTHFIHAKISDNT